MPFAFRSAVAFTLLALALMQPAAGVERKGRPGSGIRPRNTERPAPPPPPPPGGWETRVGSDSPPARRAPAATKDEEVQEAPPPPPPEPPHPLFDDRPLPPGPAPVWIHRPSANVVSNETYTADACTHLLDDPNLPPGARAGVLGGRARARLRMWRVDDSLADIESAVALDGSAAQLQLILADVLASLGRVDEADTILQQAFRLDPESTLTARALGLIRFQQGNLETAAEALRFHIEGRLGLGVAPADATLPVLSAVAAGATGSLESKDDPSAPWPEQLAAFVSGRIDRKLLLERARDPRGASADEAACTAWFYLGQMSLSRGDRERAGLDYLAGLRTGSTAAVEYRLAAAALIRLGVIAPDSLPGLLAP